MCSDAHSITLIYFWPTKKVRLITKSIRPFWPDFFSVRRGKKVYTECNNYRFRTPTRNSIHSMQVLNEFCHGLRCFLYMYAEEIWAKIVLKRSFHLIIVRSESKSPIFSLVFFWVIHRCMWYVNVWYVYCCIAYTVSLWGLWVILTMTSSHVSQCTQVIRVYGAPSEETEYLCQCGITILLLVSTILFCF